MCYKNNIKNSFIKEYAHKSAKWLLDKAITYHLGRSGFNSESHIFSYSGGVRIQAWLVT